MRSISTKNRNNVVKFSNNTPENISRGRIIQSFMAYHFKFDNRFEMGLINQQQAKSPFGYTQKKQNKKPVSQYFHNQFLRLYYVYKLYERGVVIE